MNGKRNLKMNLHSENTAETINYYNQNADEFFRESVVIDMSEIYPQFLKLIPAGGKILDAGCGSGRDSLYFLQKGFDVTAIDASAEMVCKATELTKLNVLHMSFEEINWSEKFDGVWACSSLLHLPKNELGNVFAKMLKALKTGGVLYASFKKGAGEATEKGRFFSYYGEDELREILKNVGSNTIEKCWVDRDTRPARQNQNWINLLIKRI